MNIIQVSLNIKHTELPPTDNHYTGLVGKVKHHGKKLLDQIREAIRIHMTDRRSPGFHRRRSPPTLYNLPALVSSKSIPDSPHPPPNFLDWPQCTCGSFPIPSHHI